jgi:dehydrogenase/reductase SDR family protein 12
MTRIQERISADLPVEDAFDYIADFTTNAEWDPNTTAARRLDEGPIGVGAHYEVHVRLGGRTAPMTYRITEYDRPNRVVLVGEGSGVSSVDDIRFERSADGTTVDYAADIQLGGFLRLVQPFLGNRFERLGKDAAARMTRELQRLAAAQTAHTEPSA